MQNPMCADNACALIILNYADFEIMISDEMLFLKALICSLVKVMIHPLAKALICSVVTCNAFSEAQLFLQPRNGRSCSSHCHCSASA